MRLKTVIVLTSLAITIVIFVPMQNISFVKPAFQSTRKIQLRFEGIEKIRYGYSAQFLLQNGGAKTLYYVGYSKDDSCSTKIKVNGTVVQQDPNPCWCGTGLAERKLEPGEIAHYNIDVSNQHGRLEVGFDFEVGDARRAQTFWSPEFVTF